MHVVVGGGRRMLSLDYRSLDHEDLRDTDVHTMEFLDFGLDARNDMDFEDASFLEGLSIFLHVCRKGKNNSV